MKNDINKQLEIGKKIEREHSDTIKKIIADVKAGKVKPFEDYFTDIAKDHLKELKDYYTRLVKMEKEAELNESIKLDIEVGDTILSGKFRNKKVVVKTIGIDENGSPTVNGKSILNIRIEKLMKDKKKLKESDNLIKTLLREELKKRLK